MLASVLIIVFSFILLVYWFRYSCILLLSKYSQPESRFSHLEQHRFSFVQAREKLQVEPELDPIHVSLQRDYQVIKYLVEHAAGLGLESLEHRLLVLDYRAMQCWYRLTRSAAPAQARRALLEMAAVLAVLGRRIGEQAAMRSET
jgi:hypothetical protein